VLRRFDDVSHAAGARVRCVALLIHPEEVVRGHADDCTAAIVRLTIPLSQFRVIFHLDECGPRANRRRSPKTNHAALEISNQADGEIGIAQSGK
jgi:hypothetical protein